MTTVRLGFTKGKPEGNLETRRLDEHVLQAAATIIIIMIFIIRLTHRRPGLVECK